MSQSDLLLFLLLTESESDSESPTPSPLLVDYLIGLVSGPSLLGGSVLQTPGPIDPSKTAVTRMGL